MTALSLRQRGRLGISSRGGRRGSSFSPKQLPDFAFWYDAAQSPVVETAGAIERLDDISGNANHASQTSAGAQPIKTVDAAGRRVIRFDGSDDSLSVATPPGFASGVTVFVAFRMRERSDFTGILSAAAAAGADHVDFFTFQNASAASNLFQLSGRSAESDTLLWQPADDGGLAYAIFALGAGSGVFRAQDGTTGDTYDGSFGTPEEIVLGARFDSGLFGHAAVDLFEVGLYSRRLDEGELDLLEAYLAGKYQTGLGVMALFDATAAGWHPDDYADVAFSRPSAAWAWDDVNHTLLAFASGEPQHVPGRGALLAPQRTNFIDRSFDLTTGWGVSGSLIRLLNQTGIDGVANKATYLEDTSTGAFSRVQSPSLSLSSTGAHVVTVFIAKDSNETRFPEVQLRSPMVPVTNSIQINTKTGATNIREGSPAYVTVDDGGNWWILRIGFTAVATSGGVYIFPAVTTTFGAAQATATGSIVVGHVGLEAGVFATSPIPTNASTVTRLADRLSVAAPGVAPGEIGIEIGFELVHAPAEVGNTNLRVFGSDDGAGATEEIRTEGAAAWAWTAGAGNKGGTLQVATADLAAGNQHTLGLSLTDSEQVAVLDGSTELDDSQALALDHSDGELQLGFWDGTGAMQMPEMWLRRFSYWTRNVVRSRIGG